MNSLDKNSGIYSRVIRQGISDWIASHGHTVTDDGSQWHILVLNSDDGSETFTANTLNQARTILGY